MNTILKTVSLTIACVLASPSAQAGDVYGGIYDHAGKTLFPSSKTREGGADIEIGMRSNKVEALGVIGHPAVYAALDLNTAGRTSFVAAGLAWKVPLSQHWYMGPGLGLAYHSGYALLPDFRAPGLSQAEIDRRVALRSSHIEFGSRVLFHDSLSLGYQFESGDAAELSVAHLSNGYIFGKVNQGLTSLGVRYVHHFGG